MNHTFVLYTEGGQRDSLRELIRVVLTLTPADSKRPTCSYDTLAFASMYFDEDEDDISPVEWNSGLFFSPCEMTRSVRGPSVQLSGTCSDVITPAHAITLSSSNGGTTWSSETPYSDVVAFKQASVMAVNTTGSPQKLALCVRTTRSFASGKRTAICPIVAYRQLANVGRIVSPSNLYLQAYLVTDRFPHGDVLRPEDTKRPLFSEPISCAALPAYSTWRVSQDAKGNIHLKSDECPDLGSVSATKPWEQPIKEIQVQLRTLQKSLDNNLERLASIEVSVNSMTAGSSGTDQRVPALEAQSDKLTKSFDQTRSYLSSVQRFLENTRQQMAGLDGKVPEIEAKVSKLAESFHESQELVQGLDNRVALVEEKTEKLAVSLEHGQSGLGSTDEAPVIFPAGKHDVSSASLPDQLSDSRFPSLPSF